MENEELSPEELEAHRATHKVVEVQHDGRNYAVEVCGVEVSLIEKFDDGSERPYSIVNLLNGKMALFLTPEQEQQMREQLVQRIALLQQQMQEGQDDESALVVESPLEL